jgi:hypothetical protein
VYRRLSHELRTFESVRRTLSEALSFYDLFERDQLYWPALEDLHTPRSHILAEPASSERMTIFSKKTIENSQSKVPN